MLTLNIFGSFVKASIVNDGMKELWIGNMEIPSCAATFLLMNISSLSIVLLALLITQPPTSKIAFFCQLFLLSQLFCPLNFSCFPSSYGTCITFAFYRWEEGELTISHWAMQCIPHPAWAQLFCQVQINRVGGVIPVPESRVSDMGVGVLIWDFRVIGICLLCSRGTGQTEFVRRKVSARLSSVSVRILGSEDPRSHHFVVCLWLWQPQWEVLSRLHLAHFQLSPGKSRGSREIWRAEGMDFPIPPEFWWSTDNLSASIFLQGVDQEILPCGQGRIDSVIINPSLLMMRDCHILTESKTNFSDLYLIHLWNSNWWKTRIFHWKYQATRIWKCKTLCKSSIPYSLYFWYWIVTKSSNWTRYNKANMLEVFWCIIVYFFNFNLKLFR